MGWEREIFRPKENCGEEFWLLQFKYNFFKLLNEKHWRLDSNQDLESF
jgi:hypothetical protein